MLGPLGLHGLEAAREVLFLGAIVVLELLLAAEEVLLLLLIGGFDLAHALRAGGVALGEVELQLLAAGVELGAALGEGLLQALLLVLPELLLLADDLALQLLVLGDEAGLLELVVGEQRLLALDEGLLELGFLVLEVLFQEAPLGLQTFLEPAPLGLVLVLVGSVELVHALGELLVEAKAVLLDAFFLRAKPGFELEDLLLELLGQALLLAREGLAVVLDEVGHVALVAAAEIGLLGLDLLVEEALLAFQVLLLGADGLALDLEALEEGLLGLLEGLLLMGQRGLELLLGILARDLDRVDDLTAQGADRGLPAGDLALEGVDLHRELEALLLDVRVLLAADLLAQVLAHLRFHAVLVLHRGFPGLDRLAPALDRLVLLLGLVGQLVAAAAGAGGLVARGGELLVHLVHALEGPAQGEPRGVEVVDVRGVEVLRGLVGLGSVVIHGRWTRRRPRREILPEPCYEFMTSPLKDIPRSRFHSFRFLRKSEINGNAICEFC